MPRVQLNKIIDTIRQIRYSRPKPKFCPKCKSHEIYLKPNYGILPQKYHCNKCGYEGNVVLEIEGKEDKRDLNI